MKIPHYTPSKKRINGQGLVEFAIVVPILLLLILGIIEGGRLIFIYTSLSAAGREAARYGAGIGADSSSVNLYNDCAGIRAAAKRIGAFAGIQDSDIQILHDTGPSSTATPTPYCSGSTGTETFQQGDRILVDIHAGFSVMEPLVHIPPLTLHTQNAHTILLDAQVVAEPQPRITVGATVCNVSDLSITTPDDPAGKVIHFKINNGTAQPITINKILIAWNQGGSPVLQSITGDITDPYPPPVTSTQMYYQKGITLVVPAASGTPSVPGTKAFTLTFSKKLNSAVVIQLTLNTNPPCSFGF